MAERACEQPEAAALVQTDGRRLVYAGLQSQDRRAAGTRLGFEAVEHGLANTASARLGLRVHALDFGVAVVAADLSAGA